MFESTLTPKTLSMSVSAAERPGFDAIRRNARQGRAELLQPAQVLANILPLKAETAR